MQLSGNSAFQSIHGTIWHSIQALRATWAAGRQLSAQTSGDLASARNLFGPSNRGPRNTTLSLVRNTQGLLFVLPVLVRRYFIVFRSVISAESRGSRLLYGRCTARFSGVFRHRADIYNPSGNLGTFFPQLHSQSTPEKETLGNNDWLHI